MKLFEKNLRLLIDLHTAMSNKNEDEANIIRDEIDSVWRDLSDKEQEVMDEVSVALYGDYEK